jgi:hypothetical protein
VAGKPPRTDVSSPHEALKEICAYRRISGEQRDALAEVLETTRRDDDTGTILGERWPAALARLAVAYGIPVAWLISETGAPDDAVEGGCGAQLRRWRGRSRLSIADAAVIAGLSVPDYAGLESGRSAAESGAVALLRLAEAMDVPLFDLLAADPAAGENDGPPPHIASRA